MAIQKDLVAKKGKRGGAGFLRQLAFLYRFLKGVSAEYRRESLKFAWAVIKNCPDHFPGVMPFVTMGVHFCKFSAENVLPGLDKQLAHLPEEHTAQDESSDVLVGS